MFRLVLLLTTLAVVACAPKAKEPVASGSGSAAAETADDAKIPGDDASKAFAAKLVKFDAQDFRPTDAPGARFTYKTIDFRGDNTWIAQAQMEADGESIDCKETGTWTMDAADDDHTAMMDWKLDKTTCAGRPTENIMRVKVNIEQGQYRIVFR